jgi:DNA-binding beta-propeller fold protein YncE
MWGSSSPAADRASRRNRSWKTWSSAKLAGNIFRATTRLVRNPALTPLNQAGAVYVTNSQNNRVLKLAAG